MNEMLAICVPFWSVADFPQFWGNNEVPGQASICQVKYFKNLKTTLTLWVPILLSYFLTGNRFSPNFRITMELQTSVKLPKFQERFRNWAKISCCCCDNFWRGADFSQISGKQSQNYDRNNIDFVELVFERKSIFPQIFGKHRRFGEA